LQRELRDENNIAHEYQFIMLSVRHLLAAISDGRQLSD
jgi:hypothetical protein